MEKVAGRNESAPALFGVQKGSVRRAGVCFCRAVQKDQGMSPYIRRCMSHANYVAIIWLSCLIRSPEPRSRLLSLLGCNWTLSC